MIDDLSVATSANFYSIRKKLSDKAVEGLFVALRASKGITAHNEFKHTREQLDGARWSAVCFRYESPPSFLQDTTAIRETLCGFLLLIEYQDHAAVLSSRLSLPSSARDLKARRRAQAALQNLLGYLKEHSGEHAVAPPENVIVFDEAQRAWDSETGQKLLGRPQSEPALFLEIMTKLPWSCLVCLVGPGQEINRGEGGLSLWGAALSEAAARGVMWDVHASPMALRQNDGLVGLGILDGLTNVPFTVVEEQHLHLAVGLRAYRNAQHGRWVEAILGSDLDGAAAIARSLDAPPARITRDLANLRSWLAPKRRGGRRVGLLASSAAARLVAEGIPPSPRSDELDAVTHWFLKPAGDFRSSNALEVPLSEFVCQGLEIDYAGLCWGGDLIWDDGRWTPRTMRAPNWAKVTNADRKAFRLNAYRVLLTRARAGLAIFVPRGDPDDPTRKPGEFDAVFDALVKAGCEPT